MYTCANCEEPFKTKKALAKHQEDELISASNIAAEGVLDLHKLHGIFVAISKIAWHDEPNWSTGLTASERESVLALAREGIHITRKVS